MQNGKRVVNISKQVISSTCITSELERGKKISALLRESAAWSFFVDSSDPLTILRAGLSIVKNMKYRPCCFYKTNQQSKQAQDPTAKKFLYYIRPECHNAQPEWILRRFFNSTSRSEEATN